MLNVFVLHQGRLRQVTQLEELDSEKLVPIWIDLESPDQKDREWVRKHCNLELPEPEDDLEASARIFETEDKALHLRSDFLLDDEDKGFRIVPVAFAVYDNLLLSVREDDLPVFRLFRLRARNQPGYVQDVWDVLLDLYATDAEYAADALEEVYAELKDIGAKVLKQQITDQVAEDALARVAQVEDINGYIRRNLMDTRRVVSFLMRKNIIRERQFDEARAILRDIESLDGHTAFLFDKINFLMDATVGFVNINQNKIIKIFSVASVALLPPTLIASVYGMNFKFMPELSQSWGYPMALGMMALSVIAPLWWFWYKGYLK